MKLKIPSRVKMILGIILVIILPIAIEVIYFNYHAIFNAYTRIEYTPNISDDRYQVILDDNVLSFQFNQDYYVDKIFIELEQKENLEYQLVVSYKNSFEKDVTEIYYDNTYEEVRQGVTKVGENAISCQIVLPEDCDNNISYVSFCNEFHINRYRLIILYVVMLILFLFICCGNLFRDKVEWIFLIVSLLTGICFILINGSVRSSWDEEIHFANAYALSYGDEVIWSDAAWKTAKIDWPYFNTYEEKTMVTEWINSQNNYDNPIIDSKSSYISFNERSYIPQALFLKIARVLNMSFNHMYMFGKVGNLLTYSLIIFIAIKIAKSNKIVIASLSLLPTLIFLASTYTNDAVTTAFIVLGFVIWYNAIIEREKIVWYKIIVGISSIVIGCFAKAVYIPILLLYCFLPQYKFKYKKQHILYVICILAVFVLVMCTFVLPAVTNAVGNNTSWGSDLRGGDTSVVSQLLSILTHPIQYAALLLKSFFQSAGEYFYGCEGWLNFSLSGSTMPQRFVYLLMPYLIFIIFVKMHNGKEIILSVKYKIAVMLAIILSLILIWTALYLSYNPVGQELIDGVQARYYAPFLVAIALIGKNSRLTIKISEIWYNRISLAIPIYLLMYGIYYVVFLNKVV